MPLGMFPRSKKGAEDHIPSPCKLHLENTGSLQEIFKVAIHLNNNPLASGTRWLVHPL